MDSYNSTKYAKAMRLQKWTIKVLNKTRETTVWILSSHKNTTPTEKPNSTVQVGGMGVDQWGEGQAWAGRLKIVFEKYPVTSATSHVQSTKLSAGQSEVQDMKFIWFRPPETNPYAGECDLSSHTVTHAEDQQGSNLVFCSISMFKYKTMFLWYKEI